MKITALEEYGLRCLLSMAQASESGLVTLREIAEREKLSVQYVSKILNMLVKRGLVESTRGSKGGYRLTRSPEDISLLDVQLALGQRLFDGRFCDQHSGLVVLCPHDGPGCGVRSLWNILTQHIERILKHTTLAHIMGREEKVLENLTKELRRSLDEENKMNSKEAL